MTGILLLAHGSREDGTEETMKKIVSYVREKTQLDLIEEAYLQFREVNLESGLLKLVERGADEIRVVPYFLFNGVHIKEDIPGEIAAFCEKHPEIKVTLAPTLGADERLAQVLCDRILASV